MLPQEILKAADSHHQWGLMCDYDGTLTPIVATPSEALMAPERLQILQRLAGCPHIALAIVSGRSVAQLRHFLSPLISEPILFCGLHGGEIYQYPQQDILQVPSQELSEPIAAFKQAFMQHLTEHQLLDSVFLEDKQYSLAVHYRRATPRRKQDIIACLQAFYEDLPDIREQYRLQPGKEVLELVPRHFNKGSCVHTVSQHWQKSVQPDLPMRLLYAGDDLTDEAAFEAVNALGGYSVRIGTPEASSAAQYYLESVAALYEVLDSLLQASVILGL